MTLLSSIGEATAERAPTLRAAIADGARLLSAAGIESGRLDAEVLLSDTLALATTELYSALDARLRSQGERRYRDLLARRARREPVAYITGRKEFWSLEFLVTRDVLIPRPETERLVEIALERAQSSSAKSPLRILDLGTGSGAITVALAKELPQAHITAVDISPAALAVAQRNAERHGVGHRVDFSCGDWFAAARGRFDLIVSNPPYIRRDELAALAPEIRQWEPVEALDGGVDGLDGCRRISAEAHRHLASGGQIVLEIGADMARAVSALFAGAGYYAPCSIHKDYAGCDRVIATQSTARTSSTAAGSARG